MAEAIQICIYYGGRPYILNLKSSSPVRLPKTFYSAETTALSDSEREICHEGKAVSTNDTHFTKEVYPHESPAILRVVFGVKPDRKIRIWFPRFQRLRELLDGFALVNLHLQVGAQIIVDAIS
jgi:hypothetical protein